jgi:hypothetical protein
MPETSVERSTDEWIRVGTLEELKARGMVVVRGRTCHCSSSTTGTASSHSTTVVLILVFRFIGAPSKMGF